MAVAIGNEWLVLSVCSASALRGRPDEDRSAGDGEGRQW